MPTITSEKYTSTLKPTRIQVVNSDPGIVRIFLKNRTYPHRKYEAASTRKEVIIGSLTGNPDLFVIDASGVSFSNNPLVTVAIYINMYDDTNFANVGKGDMLLNSDTAVTY